MTEIEIQVSTKKFFCSKCDLLEGKFCFILSSLGMIANVTLIPKKHSVTDLEFRETDMLHFCFWQFLGP